ncbi:relaxase/mobilization nuclease domain-containing protein [Streptomyces sp. DH41]|uniref:relaxase/mobilization nuclease domain-containing protein n=1 Tax=Streptomyces sp. DH41 TaxID=3040125 RepID=UPI0024433EEC|nr:mobilization protein [Streptomyces sp. DH41]MDG9728435.1 mobilization protein [Streptomyces sp. DH41]
MIPEKLDEGSDTYGLLHYLYGPGRRDEHTDPHMVGAWDQYVDDPARSPEMTISDLALLLDAPVFAMRGKKPKLHVYHVAVRNAPEDRILSDAEWAEVAREMMHAAGIAEHDDDEACRWVAIRHADDHIHLVATKAREDGRQPNLRQDIVKMHAAARAFEVQFDLRRLKHGDKTAAQWRRAGELEKAERRGLKEAPRVTLQRTVREAAAAATSEADFFARLTTSGLRVKQRIAPDGNVTGYSVAMPGDRNPEQTPIWFSGARLAPDLSLPRVRERWSKQVPAPRAAPAELWRVAESKVRAAADQLGAEGLHEGAGEVAALGDLIVVAAVISPRLVRREIKDAAYEFERAARAPGDRALESQARTLYRESAHLLSQSAAAAGRSDAVAALGFLLALVTAVEASRRWHQAQEHRAQAEASGRAGRLLREAVEVTAGAAAAREYQPRPKRAAARPGGPRRTPSVSGERPMAGVLQQALPEQATAILADPAWPALRTRLIAVEKTGEDPVGVLSAVAARRELGSADSVAEVLTWRLDGWSRQRGATAAATGRSPSPTSTGGTGRTSGPRKTGAPGPARRPPGDEQRKGPRRAR